MPHTAFPSFQAVSISYCTHFLSDVSEPIKTTRQDLSFRLSLIHFSISLSDLVLTSSQRLPFNGSEPSTTPILRT